MIMTAPAHTPRSWAAIAILALTTAAWSAGSAWGGSGHSAALPTPIRHVVVVFQENHSFDNVLGRYCSLVDSGAIDRASCAGVRTGRLANGRLIGLRSATDIVAGAMHDVASQHTAIDGGKMDGFSRILNCRPATGLNCYTQYTVNGGPCGGGGTQSCIQNLVSLATHFAISDHTFEFRSSPSFGGHLDIVAASNDHFLGDNPTAFRFEDGVGPGWGCDSDKNAPWWNGARTVQEPSCVPDAAGNGPYRPSPVQHVSTLMDLLDRAGDSWNIYGGQGYEGRAGLKSGYLWSVCPSFYSCLSQHSDQLVPADAILGDAAAGHLPAYSLVTPVVFQSQHNRQSMAAGDTWIGEVVQAIENGPDWDSTAIFITWDDCGCFYDHMNPLRYSTRWGIRVPLLIVSPFARPGFTDTNPGTFASIIAFTEHVFDLPPLAPCLVVQSATCDDDTTAYDYMQAFDFSQSPLPPVTMVRTGIPPSDRRWLATHPVTDEDVT